MGDIADWLVDQMIEQGQWSGKRGRRYYDHMLPKKTLQDFADEAVEDFENDEKAKDLNKGVLDF